MNYQSPYPPPPPQFEKPNNSLGKDIAKIVGLQLGIFLFYQSILYYLISVKGLSQMGVWEMLIVVLHWITSLVLMIVFLATRRMGIGLGFLISFIVLLVIGFGSCAYIFAGGVGRGMNDVQLQQMIHDDSINAAQTAAADSTREAQEALNRDTLTDTLSH